jgi:hypothetical protein
MQRTAHAQPDRSTFQVEQPHRPSPNVAARRPRGLGALRVMLWLMLAQVFAQAAFAGQILSGNATGRTLHEVNAHLIHLVALIQLVLAIIVWRSTGRGLIALAGLALFMAVELQLGFGYARHLALHVPLGLAIFGLILTLLLTTMRSAMDRKR